MGYPQQNRDEGEEAASRKLTLRERYDWRAVALLVVAALAVAAFEIWAWS